jgi:hypothetical protein
MSAQDFVLRDSSSTTKIKRELPQSLFSSAKTIGPIDYSDAANRTNRATNQANTSANSAGARCSAH